MFENQSDEIKNYVKNYASNPISFLLLAGENGTGKTFAAELIYKKRQDWYFDAIREQGWLKGNLLMDHYQAFMIKQADLQTKFLIAHDQGRIGDLIDLLKMTKLLIIDDLGTRAPSAAFGDMLYAIADYRYENRRDCATVITTNLNSEDMRKQFGDAFVSRVASTKCFRFVGPDSRFNQF